MLPKYIFIQCENFNLLIMYDTLFSDALITSKINKQLNYQQTFTSKKLSSDQERKSVGRHSWPFSEPCKKDNSAVTWPKNRKWQPILPNLSLWLKTVKSELFRGQLVLHWSPECVWGLLYLVRFRLILHGSSSMYFFSSKMRLMMGFSTSCKYSMPTAWQQNNNMCKTLHLIWVAGNFWYPSW